MFKLSQIGNIQLLLVLLILAGISVGTYVAQNRTNISPNAQQRSESNMPDTAFYLEAVYPNFGQFVSDQKPGVKEGSLSQALKKASDLNLPEVLFPNQRVAVNLYVSSDIDEANLFAANLVFPKEILEVQSINKVPQKITIDLEDGELACAGKKGIRCPSGYSCRLDEKIWDKEGKCVKNKQAESSRSGEENNAKVDSFVSFWAEEAFDNEKGTISLIGAVPNPGFKTENNTKAYMVTIIFKTKTAGKAPINFTPESKIYRNSDNADILKTKQGIELNIVEKPDFKPSRKPDPTPHMSLSPSPLKIKGDGNGDGKVDLTDLSIILKMLGKNSAGFPELDYNGDGRINAFDFSRQLTRILSKN